MYVIVYVSNVCSFYFIKKYSFYFIQKINENKGANKTKTKKNITSKIIYSFHESKNIIRNSDYKQVLRSNIDQSIKHVSVRQPIFHGNSNYVDTEKWNVSSLFGNRCAAFMLKQDVSYVLQM